MENHDKGGSAGKGLTLEWRIGGRGHRLDFSRPILMGIVNVTPDSFSDGGLFLSPESAIALAERHLRDGAQIIDLGGETTRPGSLPTSQEEEWRRLEPVLAALAAMPARPVVSVDTYKAAIAEKALLAGAAMLNDIYAGRKEPGILDVASDRGAPIILMHMLGEPRTMQVEPRYDDVVREVREFLVERARAAMEAGIPRERIILDPGLGFGKNAGHNLTLLNRFEEVIPPGFHSVMALSRKAFLGRIIEDPDPLRRDPATAAASAIAVLKGAEILRVHDVAQSLLASKVAWATRRESL
ncbi:MAG: dihydropteroate synthase [Deltaproteobacteria bacterium]|jgi:dihydropteroate synthase|nr:dihydropteroate synthase [Deltaproteobacteria bacterium]